MQFREELIETEAFKAEQRKFSKHVLSYFEKPGQPIIDYEGLKDHNAHMIPLTEYDLHLVYACSVHFVRNAIRAFSGLEQDHQDIIEEGVKEHLWKHAQEPLK
ncbi:MAG: hypothetical protein IPP74_10305 [Alphaproteobacteria bacterium]|nr:hypothetical protein [Alphaproteobacteria bacterium]